MESVLFSNSRLPKNIQTAVTVGTFDGVHKGHQKILKVLLEAARRQSLRSLVITFDPHPDKVFNPGNKIKVLTSTRKKVRLFTELGVNYFVVIKFDRGFSRLSPETFVKDYLLSRYCMRTLVVGYDHGFGKDRIGTEKYLSEISAVLDFDLIKVPPVVIGGEPVSSSRIRAAIARGEMPLATHLLGRHYSLSGKVVTGSGRGRKLGRPTANLELANPDKQLFSEGIYACYIDLDGKLFCGVMHYGPRPTFNERDSTIELNLFDFDGDLYGRTLEISIVERIRAINRFGSEEELKKKMDQDDRRAREILEKIKINGDFLSRAV
jgi:riboflavin kinase/FMN adenylyltransferase